MSYTYFKIPRLIAELSAGMTLDPGDIISTGTPAGDGHTRTAPESMKAGLWASTCCATESAANKQHPP